MSRSRWYLELSDEQHHKFYWVEVRDQVVITRWGRIGCPGQGKEYAFTSKRAAQDLARRKVKEKQAKGYEGATPGIRAKRKPSVAEKKIAAYVPIPGMCIGLGGRMARPGRRIWDRLMSEAPSTSGRCCGGRGRPSVLMTGRDHHTKETQMLVVAQMYILTKWTGGPRC
jgi:predicted DNA-binding WGR domain protein